MYNLDLEQELYQFPHLWNVSEKTVNRFREMKKVLLSKDLHFDFFIAEFESDSWISAIGAGHNFTVKILDETTHNNSVYISTFDSAVNALIDSVLSVVE